MCREITKKFAYVEKMLYLCGEFGKIDKSRKTAALKVERQKITDKRRKTAALKG